MCRALTALEHTARYYIIAKIRYQTGTLSVLSRLAAEVHDFALVRMLHSTFHLLALLTELAFSTARACRRVLREKQKVTYLQ